MPLDMYAIKNVRPITFRAGEPDGFKIIHFGGEWSDREEGAPVGWCDGDVLIHERVSYTVYLEFRKKVSIGLWGIRWDPDDMPENVPPEVLDHPIWKLINYSDCEGVFGPVMARKIACALEESKSACVAGIWWPLWKQLLRVFRSAADVGGIVAFG